MTAFEAITLAGLDWEVETAPIVTNDHKRTGIERYRVTRRVSDNAILGVVKRGYVPIQNRDAFRMFDGVMGKPGRPVYHTAGSLEGGSKVFILAKLPGMMEVGKGIGPVDEVERYLLLSNAHDGTRPMQMLFTPVRVVCSNTLSMALHQKDYADEDAVLKTAPRVAIRHNINAKFYMREAERTMGRALLYYEKFGEFADHLYSRQLKFSQVDGIISLVFPPNKKKEVTPAVAQHRENVERLFTEGKGHEKIAGSAWALLQAFAEYADHGYAVEKARDASDRSYSIIMGGAKGIKQRAAKHIAEAVEA